MTAVLAVGVRRVAQAAPRTRSRLAAATAACLAFALSALYDWHWQMSALAIAFIVLAAMLAARSAPPGMRAKRLRTPARVAAAAVCVAAMVATALPLADASGVRSSQESYGARELDSALADAQRARAAEPYAGAPNMQEALVLERLGRYDEAALAAREATVADPTNWRTWLTLSRIDALRGEASEATAAYERARSLNPRSLLFRR